MATNYTTKTAALRATQIDGRQIAVSKKIEIGKSGQGTTVSEDKVTTKQVWIDDENGAQANVLDLIKNAGLNVGSDADGDYTPDANPVKTNKINFLGAYVNVVDNGEEGVNIYIGENKNHPSYSSITDTLTGANIPYASSTSAWTLPSDASAGTSYARTSALSGTEDVKLNNATEIGNILADATIKVVVTSDQGTFEFETTKISEEAGTTSSAKSKTWTSEDGAIKVVGSSLIKYSSDDAKNGFTPNSSSGKFTVTVDNDKVVGENGGWYSVSVKLGGVTKSTSNVYVYGTQKETPSVGKPVITYNAGTTKQISGLDYDSSATFTLTVEDIANTQQSMTSSTNRVKITKTSGDVDFGATVTTTTTGMSLQSGTATDETAVYKYTATASVTNSTAGKKVSAAAKAQAYGQTALAGSQVTSDTCTATTFLYTDNGDDTDLVTKFQKDGARKYATLADAKSAAGATTAYDSSKSLVTDYTDQLLVQYGTVKYPNSDSTTRYSGCTGTRYYVRPVKFGGSGQINTISVTVSGWSSSYQHDKTRLYLVKQGMTDVMVLNCFKNGSSSYGTPIANEQTPASGKWTCEINNELWQLIGGATGYYLVVEMDETNNTTVGQITLA